MQPLNYNYARVENLQGSYVYNVANRGVVRCNGFIYASNCVGQFSYIITRIYDRLHGCLCICKFQVLKQRYWASKGANFIALDINHTQYIYIVPLLQEWQHDVA